MSYTILKSISIAQFRIVAIPKALLKCFIDISRKIIRRFLFDVHTKVISSCSYPGLIPSLAPLGIDENYLPDVGNPKSC